METITKLVKPPSSAPAVSPRPLARQGALRPLSPLYGEETKCQRGKNNNKNNTFKTQWCVCVWMRRGVSLRLGFSAVQGSAVRTVAGPGLVGAAFAKASRLVGKRSPQLPLSRRPRTLKARGSHLKPGNAQTGNSLPPKQFSCSLVERRPIEAE